MQLSLFTDYGLRALALLATHPQRVITAHEIADTFSISIHHLRKIIQTLVAAGIIVTVRGAGGGIQLAKPAEELFLADLIRILEGPQEIVECIGKTGPCLLLAQKCGIKKYLIAGQNAFYRELANISLAQSIAQQ